MFLPYDETVLGRKLTNRGKVFRARSELLREIVPRHRTRLAIAAFDSSDVVQEHGTGLAL
jgi:hypothetical protein